MAPVNPPSDAEMKKRILETARELQDLIAQSPKGQSDPHWGAFQSFINLHEFPDEVQAALLSEFIELVLPDLGRHARPLRSTLLHNQDIPEQELESLNGWLGTLPARLRQLEWLDSPALQLAGDSPLRGIHSARPGETGVCLGRSLHVLMDGRLALLHVVGTWSTLQHRARTVTTLADAQLVEPWVALQEFPLYRMLRALRSCLWEQVPSQAGTAHAPDLEARRARFTALVTGLDHASRAHAQQLRRVGDEPA